MENFLNKLVDPKLPQDQQKKLRSRYATMIVCGVVLVSAVIVILISSAMSGNSLNNRVAEVIATIDQNNQTAVEELKAANEALDSVTEELNAAKDIITALTERLDAADEAAKANEERMAAAESALTETSAKLEEETGKLAESTGAQIDEAIAALTTDLEKANARIAELETAAAARDEAANAHAEEYAAVQKDVAYLLETMRLVAKSALGSSNRLDKLESDTAKLTASVNMDKEALTAAQADIAGIQQEQTDAKAAQDKVNAAQDKVNADVQSSLDKLSLDVDVIIDFMSGISETYPTAEKNITYLLETMKLVAKAALNNGNRLDKAEPALSGAQANIEALSASVDTLNEGIGAANEAIAKADEAFLTYTGEADAKFVSVDAELEKIVSDNAEQIGGIETRIDELDTQLEEIEKTQSDTSASLQKSIDTMDVSIAALTEQQDKDAGRIDELDSQQKNMTSRLTVVTDNVNTIESRMAETDVNLEDIKAKQTSLTNRQAKTDAVLEEFSVSTTDKLSVLEKKTDDTIAELNTEKDKLSVYIAEEDEKDRGVSARVQVAEAALKGMEKHDDRLKVLEASVRKIDGQIKNIDPSLSTSGRSISPEYSQATVPTETLADLKNFIVYSSEIPVNEMTVSNSSTGYEYFETPDQTDIYKNVYPTSLVPYSFDEPAENFDSNDWAEYKVDGACASLSGIVYVPEVMAETDLSRKLFIYGDDVLLFESEPMTKNAEPQPFCIELDGVNVVTVVYENTANFLIADFQFQMK